MEVNEKYIKISRGKVPVEQDIKLGDEFVLTMRVACVKQEMTDNQNGSMDRTSILKPTEGVEIGGGRQTN